MKQDWEMEELGDAEHFMRVFPYMCSLAKQHGFKMRLSHLNVEWDPLYIFMEVFDLDLDLPCKEVSVFFAPTGFLISNDKVKAEAIFLYSGGEEEEEVEPWIREGIPLSIYPQFDVFAERRRKVYREGLWTFDGFEEW